MLVRRTALVLTAATAAVLAALVPATTASAASGVQVNLGGLNSTQNAGSGHPDGFSVTFKSQDRQQVAQTLRSVLVVQLNGLQPEAVHITGRFGELPKSTSGGGVTFTDPEAVVFLGGRTATTRNYQILFDAQAPDGHGQLQAFAVTTDGNQQGSDSADFTVRASNAAATHTPSPSSSPAPTVNVPIPSGQVSVAPLQDGGRATPLANEGSGVPIFIYIMGGILVAMGAAILFLLFRNPRDGAAVPAPDEPIDYPPRADPGWAPGPAGQGYPPTGPRMAAPTAQMPVVHDSRDSRTTMLPQSHPMERPTAHQPRVSNGPRMGRGSVPPGPQTAPGVDPWASPDDTLTGGSGPLPRR
jgi:hypothetical protein